MSAAFRHSSIASRAARIVHKLLATTVTFKAAYLYLSRTSLILWARLAIVVMSPATLAIPPIASILEWPDTCRSPEREREIERER